MELLPSNEYLLVTQQVNCVAPNLWSLRGPRLNSGAIKGNNDDNKKHEHGERTSRGQGGKFTGVGTREDGVKDNGNTYTPVSNCQTTHSINNKKQILLKDTPRADGGHPSILLIGQQHCT